MAAFPLHSLNLLGSCKLSLILPFTGIGENKLPYIWKPKSDFWPQVIFFKILLRWCGWRDPPCTCKYTKYIDHPQDRKYFFYFLFFLWQQMKDIHEALHLLWTEIGISPSPLARKREIAKSQKGTGNMKNWAVAYSLSNSIPVRCWAIFIAHTINCEHTLLYRCLSSSPLDSHRKPTIYLNQHFKCYALLRWWPSSYNTVFDWNSHQLLGAVNLCCSHLAGRGTVNPVLQYQISLAGREGIANTLSYPGTLTNSNPRLVECEYQSYVSMLVTFSWWGWLK